MKGFLIGLALGFLIGSTAYVRAHDHAWINNPKYVSPKTGAHCCGGTGENPDCTIYPADNVAITPQGFLLKTTGETVPYNEAIQSQDEHFYRCRDFENKLRCFFFVPPGS